MTVVQKTVAQKTVAQKKYFFVFGAIFLTMIGVLGLGAWHTHHAAQEHLARERSDEELDRASPPPEASATVDPQESRRTDSRSERAAP